MTEQDNHPDPYAPVWGEENPGDDTRVIQHIKAQNVVQPGQEIRYRNGKAEVVWSDPQAPPLWHTAAAYGAPRQPMPARRPPEGYGPPPALRDLQAQNPEIDLSAINRPERRPAWVPWVAAVIPALLVLAVAVGFALRTSNKLPAAWPVIGRDPGLDLCLAVANGGSPYGQTKPAELTEDSYRDTRDKLGAIRNEDVRRGSISIVDLAWQSRNLKDDDFAGGLAMLGTVTSAYGNLTTGCADLGVSLPPITALAD